MSILVDYRAGSHELIAPLILMGLDVDTVTLDTADVAFEGRGTHDASVNVGIEYKKISELCQSIRDGRFAGKQLPGLSTQYDHAWLLIEGMWRHDAQGLICTYMGARRGWKPLAGKMRASELEKHVLTYELCGGIHVRFTNTRADTLRFLSDLYRWWTDRRLDEHSSHLAIHQPTALVPLSPMRQAVAQWPGVGVKTSKAVEARFGGVTAAANASVEQWAQMEVDGRKFGEKRALQVVKFLRGMA